MNKVIELVSNVTDMLSGINTYNTAIILAGGSGTRFKSDDNQLKQHVKIFDIPVVVRTIMAFESCDFIDEIIVVTLQGEENIYEGYVKDYGIKKPIRTVCGGDTRQKSAIEGFKLVSDKTSYVFIHDAARCLVTPDMIRKVYRDAVKYGAAIAAYKSTDTVKLSDNKNLIDTTLDRDTVWFAQTPQVFSTEVYRASAYLSLKDGFTATDDSSLSEHIGIKVKLTDCGKENIKITSLTDLYYAEALIKSREVK